MGHQLGEALLQLCQPKLIGIILASAFYGTFFGAIPGLTATMAVALIIPITYHLDPLSALTAVATLSACAIFSGDIPSALVRMPGTPASAAYTDDVYVYSRRGLQDRALGICLVFSVVGGLFGAVLLIFFSRPMAQVATFFTVAEYFWFYLLGLGCAVVVSRGSPLLSAFALLLGLLFSTVGLSAVHTEARFVFGRPELYQGINFIPAMIGLFGLSEVLRNALVVGQKEERIATAPEAATGFLASVFEGTWTEVWRRKWATFRSGVIGALVGILPGAGADIAAWVAYGTSKRFSKKPEMYGQGSLEGVADATGANNAALAGAWVPALVFGIPGDSITALVLGIMMMKNLKPGPEIFEKQGTLLYGLYLAFIVANLILLPIGFLAIKAGSALIRIPRRVMLPVILLSCVLGSYSINGSYFDVGLMLAFGLLGFVLDRFRIPVGPVVLGIVLGGPLEERFIQAMTASQGSLLVFFSRPAAAVLGAACVALWLWPLVALLRRKRISAVNRSGAGRV